MLAEIPASHLGLLSATAHAQMIRNLNGESATTFGFEIVALDEGYFVSNVLEDGPAARAGLLRGDRILRVDDLDPSDSPRLDWRSDDAALPDLPQHAVLVLDDPGIELRVERTVGDVRLIEFDAEIDSAYQAAKRSAEVVRIEGQDIAYIHFWYVHSRGMDSLLARLVQSEFKDCDALVLDLRGRGGSAVMVNRVLRVLAGRASKWRRPIVALIDANTRSAKEMLAFELQSRGLGVLVGETTAGALLPATFVDVGGDSVLMYPAFALGKHTEAIEGVGVQPDVHVESPLPWSAGADPIRDTGMMIAAELARERQKARQPA